MKIVSNSILALLFSLLIILGVSGCESRDSTDSTVISIDNKTPKAPSGLLVEKVTKNEINLRWIDASDNEDGFKIFRDGKLIASTKRNINTYYDNNLSPATEYQYTILAFNQTGESDQAMCTVKTHNPSITITLNKIGVFDNGESFTRDNDGGEVYVYLVVTDGDAVREIRIPDQEDTFLKLKDNEITDIESVIYHTDKVSDYLSIAAVGYERDGDMFEELVYQALGSLVATQVGGSGSLLSAFNLNLEELIGSLMGSEDDWLGACEFTWGSSDEWGLGQYEDIICEEEDGTQGLRLWFTIESEDFTTSVIDPTTSSANFESFGDIILNIQISLDILNEVAFSTKYPNGTITQFPVNEYGFFCSELIPLIQNDVIRIAVESSQPIYLNNTEPNDSYGLVMTISHRISSNAFRTKDVNVLSCETIQISDNWRSDITFTVNETGEYQISLENKTGNSTIISIKVITTN